MDLFTTDTGIYHNSISSHIDVMIYLYYLLNHLEDNNIHVEFNENDMRFKIDSELYTAEGGCCLENTSIDSLGEYQDVSICKRKLF